MPQRHKCVIVNLIGCGFDPHSQELNIYLNLYFHFSLSAYPVVSGIQRENNLIYWHHFNNHSIIQALIYLEYTHTIRRVRLARRCRVAVGAHPSVAICL